MFEWQGIVLGFLIGGICGMYLGYAGGQEDWQMKLKKYINKTH